MTEYTGPQKRKQDFESEDERLAYDANNLIAIAKAKLKKDNVSPEEAFAYRTRKGEQPNELLRAIAIELKGKEPILNISQAVATQATEVTKETNGNGVLIMKSITNFVEGLELKFGVTKHQVLERLKTSLTLEKLNNLIYFQKKGHGLDVTGITPAGELEFDSCSEVAPTGHRDMSYFDAEELLAQPEYAGVDFMEKDRCQSLIDRGAILDKGTWSYLKSPDAGTRYDYGTAFACFDSQIGPIYDPIDHTDTGSFRVSIKV